MRGKAQDVAISSRDDLRLVVSLVGRTTSPSREAEQPSEGNSRAERLTFRRDHSGQVSYTFM
jgi:hypothetical protein